jgi:hypothetical protein
MAGGILTLVMAFLAGGVLWLVIGARMPLAEDLQANDLLNLVAYVGGALPIAFAVVFYVVELI